MANRFFTILIIPEKTSKVRRLVIPSWAVNAGLVVLVFSSILGLMMLMDYTYVMNQIDENKELKIESRKLRQQVQIFENKISSVEDTMERIETFATRLKIITNIVERDDLVQKLNSNLPDAATNFDIKRETAAKTPLPEDLENDEVALFEDQRELGQRLDRLYQSTLFEEQKLQDLYELLIDQKSFLLALPTKRPANGYPTSGFGVRLSPFGGRVKMHEGLDIANHPGTPIQATANGTVTFSGNRAGYGRTVIINHGYGIETWYSHAQKLLVKVGEKIRGGGKIATVGNSGRSTGHHVHYEVHVNGTPVDPRDYILEE